MAISRQKKAEAGTMPYSYFEWLERFFIVHSTIRQHCTLHAFEQFGALFMHNHDDIDTL